MANYKKILEVLIKISPKRQFLRQPRAPRLDDLGLIAICLTAEYMGIDSESHLFRMLPTALGSRIERSVYNRRKRKLFSFLEQI